MSFTILTQGLSDVARFFDELPDVATKAAVLAINDTTERVALPQIRNQINAEVAYPTGYLKEPRRLGISRRANPRSLEAAITARDRPTSLARFAAGQTPENTRKGGVRVEVKKGSRRLLKKAFLVSLKNGNRGLAVRLKPGEQLENKRDPAVRLADNVYLLYGPSVDQVFKGVASSKQDIISASLSKQFLRQFARLSNG